MTDTNDPDVREIELADAMNILQQATRRVNDVAGGRFRDDVDATGRFTFELVDADTGETETRRVVNTVVDDGENEILRWLAGRPRGPTTESFSGDGSQTEFQLPYPYFPVEDVSNVTVDGNSQSESATEYAVDYWNGTVYFSSAPSSGTDNVSVDVTYVQHPFRWLAVGTDDTSVSASDSSLGSESERVALDVGTNGGEYTHDVSAVEVTGTWLFGTGEANVSIAEAGLFGMPSTATASGTSEDTMLNRTVVSPTIDKTSSQELKVTWTLSM
jgi:hypothetical protein